MMPGIGTEWRERAKVPVVGRALLEELSCPLKGVSHNFNLIMSDLAEMSMEQLSKALVTMILEFVAVSMVRCDVKGCREHAWLFGPKRDDEWSLAPPDSIATDMNTNMDMGLYHEVWTDLSSQSARAFLRCVCHGPLDVLEMELAVVVGANNSAHGAFVFCTVHGANMARLYREYRELECATAMLLGGIGVTPERASDLPVWTSAATRAGQDWPRAAKLRREFIAQLAPHVQASHLVRRANTLEQVAPAYANVDVAPWTQVKRKRNNRYRVGVCLSLCLSLFVHPLLLISNAHTCLFCDGCRRNKWTLG
jgi:hypothetical protein